MKKKVLVFLAPGFEEIETVTVVDILRRAGVEVVIGGTIEVPIKGSRGVYLLADTSLDQAQNETWDMIVIPGGGEGVEHLGKDKRFVRILNDAVKKEIFIGAICAGPSLIAHALSGKKATSHPCVKSEMQGVNYQEARVVVDGRFITSRAPGTAMEFAFELVSQLCGKERVLVVNKGVEALL
jgi:4-methyl-5(b-hydroxyethyl)-thiazole monophosphate biosynthesis